MARPAGRRAGPITGVVRRSSPLVRGDANQDGMLNVSDAFAIAQALFNQGSTFDMTNIPISARLVAGA
jgi:hypothetical protein